MGVVSTSLCVAIRTLMACVSLKVAKAYGKKLGGQVRAEERGKADRRIGLVELYEGSYLP